MIDHISVLLHEAVEALQVQPNHWYIDATFGQGGHTREILNKGGKVIAFDVDTQAVEAGQNNFAHEIAAQRLVLIRENFSKLTESVRSVLARQNQTQVSGILFDFGTSTQQLTSSERGFSFQGSGDLDMRLDDRLGVKAKDLLMIVPENQLAELFQNLGGEREAKKIAKAIVATRSENQGQALQTVEGLVSLITKTKKEPRGHLHPATKVFQALRIAVNDELAVIETALPQALELLETHGRLVTIAFHEGEDRIVKQTFRNWSNQGKGELITKHPITPSEEEINTNLRSRSSKLRIFEKK